MSKRGAANYLTDENWDQEEEAEEAGVFVPASTDVLQKRQIKKAKRRGAGEDGAAATTGAFKGFGGFTGLQGKTTGGSPSFKFGGEMGKPLSGIFNGTSTTSSSTDSKTFSFVGQKDQGANNSGTSSVEGIKPLSNGTRKTGGRAKYLQQLKSLNESVAKWISQHVDANPYCVLTPIFKDYEKHLAEIEKLDTSTTSEKIAEGDQKSDPKTPTASSGAMSVLGSSKVTESGGFNIKSTSTAAATSSSTTAPVFSFGAAASAGFGTGTPTTGFSGFSFKSTGGDDKADKPAFSFAVGNKPKSEEATAGEEEEEYVPPKPESVEVTEDDAFYSVRCKLFYQKEGNWTERGLGNLHLKPCSGKTQLLMRADTALGNILLNIMLTSSIPVKRLGKNNVLIVCVPNPPIDTKETQDQTTPIQMMIRVKTSEMADELLKKLEENKG